MPDWASKTVLILKEELKARGLPYQGKKAELVQRLEEAGAGDATEPIQDAPATADAPITEDVVVEQPAIEVPAAQTETIEEQSNEAAVAAVEDATPANGDAPAVEPQSAPSPIVESDMEQIVTREPVQEGSTPQPAPTNDPPVVEEQSLAQAETSDDSQKRKRRSASPIPHEVSISRKRAKSSISDEEMAPAPVETEPPVQQSMDIDSAPPVQSPTHDEMELDHSVAPAQHPATVSLYISELMRPLRPDNIQEHLIKLAAAPGQAPDRDVIVNFYLDTIRTHAFVTFTSSNAASRVRSALHDRVWPNESNRKALKVDFIPAESVSSWVETEEASGGGRSGKRWEVIYQDGPDGIEARHVEAGRSNSRPGPPPRGPASFAANEPAIPTGPRDFAPRGPRPDRSPGRFQGDRTRARPSISFSLVPEELARRRIDNMHSFYTKDISRDYGREINRYSFEEGDSFVDRGKEVFEGIRPPHRERAVERERRGGRGRGGGRRGRGGRPGFRPRSDRYLPGGGGGGGRRFEDDRPWERPRW